MYWAWKASSNKLWLTFWIMQFHLVHQIAKYQLGIDINSKPLKNKMVEINTTFKFQDKEKYPLYYSKG